MSSHTLPDGETQASVHNSPKIKLLKFIVGFLGALLVIAFLIVVGTIGYRIATKGKSVDVPQADMGVPLKTDVLLEGLRPEGSTLKTVEVEGKMLYAFFAHDNGGGTIVIIDMKQGQKVRAITIP